MATRNPEAFWASDDGDSYFADLGKRSEGLLVHRKLILKSPLSLIGHVTSVLEVGAGSGVTLQAMEQLRPKATLGAVEINKAACRRLVTWVSRVWCCPIVDLPETVGVWDLVFTFGLFSSVVEEDLAEAYGAMVQVCGRFLLIIDYWAEPPDSITCPNVPYRLLRRDFAKEMARLHPEMNLVMESETLEANDLRWSLLQRRDEIPDAPGDGAFRLGDQGDDASPGASGDDERHAVAPDDDVSPPKILREAPLRICL